MTHCKTALTLADWLNLYSVFSCFDERYGVDVAGVLNDAAFATICMRWEDYGSYETF